MQEGEVCVCFFVEVLDEPQPKISRHLAVLRKTGLVTARRDAKWMHYSIAELSNPTAQIIVAQALATMGNDSESKRDRATLASACCSMRKSAASEARTEAGIHQRSIVRVRALSLSSS